VKAVTHLRQRTPRHIEELQAFPRQLVDQDKQIVSALPGNKRVMSHAASQQMQMTCRH